MTNQQPKFRAWHKELKDMFRVYRICFGSEGAMMPDLACKPAGTGIMPCSMEEIELMQWTYNIDKNNKEIYVGDIVKLGGEDIFYVTVFKGAHILSWKQGDFIHNDKLLADFKSSQIEIIGNIYETPQYLDELCAGVSRINAEEWK